MALTAGNRLGAYEVVALLGAGGMGEVYRARDTRLDRTVAIKVLPSDVASTRELRERFEREARTVAALNHPHICTLHDVGRQDDVEFLVMEYLEGETLQARLERGALPLDHALHIAVQVADALAAAHRAGVVHRDLKPGNIMLLRRAGAPDAKLLDFGLAKPAGPVAGGSASMLPTTPRGLTVQGTILGTFQYMAPEQLEGLEADARTDIFAFGAVLYEMIAGRKAFEAKSHAGLIAAILEHEPAALSSVQPGTPLQIEHVVARCLAKSPEERWQTAMDLHRELQWAAGSVERAAPPATAQPRRVVRWRPITSALAAAAALVLAALAGVVQWLVPRGSDGSPPSVVRLAIPLEGDATVRALGLPALAISPRGTDVAWIGMNGGQEQLHVRALDGFETRPLPGTESALMPFFSPDGQWIGFFAQGMLKKVSLAAGTVQTLAAAPFGRGAMWGPDGNVYFAAGPGSGIWRVPADGGMPVEITQLDRANGEVSHRWPQLLPGGNALMFTVWMGPARDESEVHLLQLSTGRRVRLVQGGTAATYVPTGHVVYARADELLAVPFDPDRLQVSNEPIRLADSVPVTNEGAAQYAVADTGVLVHLAGDRRRYERRLVWVSRDGTEEPIDAPAREYYGNAVVSPDGRRAAVDIQAGTIGIWLFDFSRRTLTPLATGNGSSQAPRWTADGKRIVYRGTRAGFRNVWWTAVDEIAAEERLTTGDSMQTAESPSADGRWLPYTVIGVQTGSDIWAMPIGGDRKPRPVVNTRAWERFPRLSPDGRLLVYTSAESGRDEVFVQPFPEPGARLQVSTEGGIEPLWSRTGREMFYRSGDRMMAVEVTTTPALKAGTPRVLFEDRYVISPNGVTGYDVGSDGRFLMVQPLRPDPPWDRIHVVLNWFEELRRTAAN